MGHDPTAAVTAVGLDEKTLSDPDGRVPVSMATAFFARAVKTRLKMSVRTLNCLLAAEDTSFFATFSTRCVVSSPSSYWLATRTGDLTRD
jgi:hypothetical protein